MVVKKKIEIGLTLDTDKNTFNLVLNDDELGYVYNENFAYNIDKHNKFNEIIGNEIYSALSFTADELQEEANRDVEPIEVAEERQVY